MEPNPGWLDDQLQAAEHEADKVLDVLRQDGYDFSTSTEPIQKRIEAWKHAILYSISIFCQHMSGNPQVRFGMLDRPAHFYCMECLVAEKIAAAHKDPYGCEACGAQVLDQQFKELTIQLANLVLHGNVCPKCAGEG